MAKQRFDKEALDRLIIAAQEAHSDALVIWKDGKPYSEWYFGKEPTKIEAMSITKAVVNLAIGRLITEGRIKSVDQPVHEFYPEWKQGRKNPRQNLVVVRMISWYVTDTTLSGMGLLRFSIWYLNSPTDPNSYLLENLLQGSVIGVR